MESLPKEEQFKKFQDISLKVKYYVNNKAKVEELEGYLKSEGTSFADLLLAFMNSEDLKIKSQMIYSIQPLLSIDFFAMQSLRETELRAFFGNCVYTEEGQERFRNVVVEFLGAKTDLIFDTLQMEISNEEEMISLIKQIIQILFEMMTDLNVGVS